MSGFPRVPRLRPGGALIFLALLMPWAFGQRQHVVAPGETLLEVAIRYGVPPSTLLEINGLATLADAVAGDVVALPSLPAQAGAYPSTASAASAGMAGPVTFDAARQWHDARQRELLSRAPELLDEFEPRAHGFAMPLVGRLSSYFGWRDVSVAGNRFHGGIDLAADAGTPVTAAGDGVVVRSGWVGAYGYAVYLEHGDGVQTRYAHLSLTLVEEGETVRQGDAIALVGSTGASTGPHLHFEIRVGGVAVDPLPYLR